MPTIRGFVEKLEVGRAGLVTAALLHDDGSRDNYVIADLDADPERFNERLSKLALLRDALNRAEPVEIEYELGEGGRNIERVARITRDALDPSLTTVTERVMVVGVAVTTDNRTGLQAEYPDTARVFGLTEDGSWQVYTLNLQIPERAAAEAQLEMIRAAQASGETIELSIDGKTQRIIGVQAGGDEQGGQQGGSEPAIIDGFVESITHTSTAKGLGGMARIEFTTAPQFTGPGQVVALVPFDPQLRTFLVVIGSPEYELFLTGLRKMLRMRVWATTLRQDQTDDSWRRPNDPAAVNRTADTPAPTLRVKVGLASSAAPGEYAKSSLALVRGAQLLHALASASRPVWVQISRKSLDVGPASECTEGVPSSDLTPRGLRDLHIPYQAEWIGWGCFNHGVYRFQFTLTTPFEIYVDGKKLCVHVSEDNTTQFAHACLECEHEVRVVLERWTCEQDFLMDVYRIR
jgi:hypothetical protein